MLKGVIENHKVHFLGGELLVVGVHLEVDALSDVFNIRNSFVHEWGFLLHFTVLVYFVLTLEISEEVLELADVYLKKHILTPKFSDDMMHIALSTAADVDVLVSWNFKHIINVYRIRGYNSVNLRLGYSTLEIRSPREIAGI